MASRLLIALLVTSLPLGCDRTESQRLQPAEGQEAPLAPAEEPRTPAITLEELRRLVPSVEEAAVSAPASTTGGDIELATHCAEGADPATAPFIPFNRSLADSGLASGSCYLPWERSDALEPESDAGGWIDLNLDGVWCGEKLGRLERAVVESRTLLVRLPPGSGTVEVRARWMLGHDEDDGFVPEGFGDWQAVHGDEMPADRVLRLPMKMLRGEATRWAQVEIRTTAGGARTVDLIWPTGC